MRLNRFFITIVLLIAITNCVKTDNQVLITDSLSDKLNLLLINSDISYNKEVIIPLTISPVKKFYFSPQCPFFYYDSLKNKAIVYSKFTNANIKKIKTLVLVNYNGLDSGLEIGTGYLYNRDTLNIKSIGLLNKSTFSIISNENELTIKTGFKLLNNKIKAEYYQDYDSEKKEKFMEEYEYKLIKNVSLEIRTNGYVCE